MVSIIDAFARQKTSAHHPRRKPEQSCEIVLAHYYENDSGFHVLIMCNTLIAQLAATIQYF